MDDSVSLDIHAISELKDKGFVSTDDAPKYSYKADDAGNYSECYMPKSCFRGNGNLLLSSVMLEVH